MVDITVCAFLSKQPQTPTGLVDSDGCVLKINLSRRLRLFPDNTMISV